MQEKTLAQSAKSKPIGKAAKLEAKPPQTHATQAREASKHLATAAQARSGKQEQRVGRNARNRAPQKRLRLRRNRHNAHGRKQGHGARP